MRPRANAASGWLALARVAGRGGLALGLAMVLAGRAAGNVAPANSGAAATFENIRPPGGPWSINVVRVPRRNAAYQILASHARNRAIGLAPVSDQAARVDPALGQAVAAINGDFYQRGGSHLGAPRGLQIMNGELVSAPNGTASFWINAAGEPNMGNTVSRLQVGWPDGSTAPIGLNSSREPGEIVLYTPRLGPATRTQRGRELVLEATDAAEWLPLRPGRMYRARVREVRELGDTPLARDTMVLSVGPIAARSSPKVTAGAELMISTATTPNLRDARQALSGGPVLVRAGARERVRADDSESYMVSSMVERHPRSAFGWNDDYFFLAEVDGRWRGRSVGMDLNEWGKFLLGLGCREAMNLDGGGSATLWYDGQVRNRPCDGDERAIANAVIVVQSPPARAAAPANGTPP